MKKINLLVKKLSVTVVLVTSLVIPQQTQSQTKNDFEPLTPTQIQKVQEILNSKSSKADVNVNRIILKFKNPEKYQILSKNHATQPPDTPNFHDLTLTALELIDRQIGFKVHHVREMSGQAHLVELTKEVNLAEARQIIAKFQNISEIEYAAIDELVTTASLPPPELIKTKFDGANIIPAGDSLYFNQWNLHTPSTTEYGIDMPLAWDITTGNSNMVVAVVDSGILSDQSEFAGRLLQGYDFISDVISSRDGDGRDSDPSDAGTWCTNANGRQISYSSWHGTHVAGIIAANADGQGSVGVNLKSKILPVRALGRCGSGTLSDIVDAIRWASGFNVPGVPNNPNPAKVINLSLGSSFNLDGCNAAYQAAIDQTFSANKIIVVAAGNESTSALTGSLAACKRIIVVAASNKSGELASYSNYGSWIDISAPGGERGDIEGIVAPYNGGSTVPRGNNYKYLNGTSMAAPHVTGVVSLMLAANPNLSFEQIVDTLRKTAQPFKVNNACNNALGGGSGIVNANRAVALARTLPPPEPRKFNVYLASMFLDAISNEGAYHKISQLQNFTNADFECRSLGWRVSVDLKEYPASIQPALWDIVWPFISQADNYDYKVRQWVPHGGKWLFGVLNPLSSFGTKDIRAIDQTLSIPASARKLTFWAMIESEEDSCENDFFVIRLGENTDGGALGLCRTHNTGQNNWAKYNLDVSKFAGQQVNIALIYSANENIHSQIFIDDLAFE